MFFSPGTGFGGLFDFGFELTGGEVGDKPYTSLKNSISGAAGFGLTGGTETVLDISQNSQLNIGSTVASFGLIGGLGTAVSTSLEQHTGTLLTIPHFPQISESPGSLLKTTKYPQAIQGVDNTTANKPREK